jgi:L-threonylcarbamoyladenylate synthase
MILRDNERTRIQAAEIIRRGGVIAFRTDTFYGLGANPLDASAVAKIKQLKGREESKPILVLVADTSDVDRFIAQRTPLFDRVAERHWPGPLTLVDKARPELPNELTAGSNRIGVRLPNDRDVRDLVRACGGSLTATSANLSGAAPARTAEDVARYFPSGVDLIIDSGEVSVSEPSTVIDLSDSRPRVVREGAIKREELEATMNETGMSFVV